MGTSLEESDSPKVPFVERPTTVSMIDRSHSSSGSVSGPSLIKMVSDGHRQSSQGSLFEQLASQAKDLVRESTRQGSQERLLAQMDKVTFPV